MFSKFIFILLLGLACQTIHGWDPQRNCNFYKTKYKPHYTIFTQSKTWNQAKADCEKEDAVLFYPKDRKETHDMIRYYYCETQTYLHKIFVGIADWIVEGNFVTVDGNPISDIYSEWIPGEPDIGGKDGCAVMQFDGLLKDDSCDNSLPYICKKMGSSQSDSVCRTEASGYKYSNQFRKCYKFHTKPKNWTDANQICNGEGSHLAVINSEEEAKYLVSITKAANKDAIKEDHVKGAVHIGFRKGDSVTRLRSDEGSDWRFGSESVSSFVNKNQWVTVTRQDLEDSGYNTWGISHRVKENANCGSMFYNGQLNAIECRQKLFFICEHDTLVFS